MRPLTTSVPVGLLLTFSLAACGDQSSTTMSEIDAWLAEQHPSTTQFSEGAGIMSAREDKGVPYKEGEGIRLDYEVTHQIHQIQFSCFGPESMHLRLSIENANGVSQGFDGDPYECAESPHYVDLSAMESMGVIAVGAQGYEATDAGAWSVVVEALPRNAR